MSKILAVLILIVLVVVLGVAIQVAFNETVSGILGEIK